MIDSSGNIGRVSVIGAGSWGTSIALVIAENRKDVDVRIWAFEKSVTSSINSRHVNEEYLPGITLPLNISAFNNLKECLSGSEVVLLATPSKAVYDTAQKMSKYLARDVHLGYLSKGFCKIHDEVYTISQALALTIPQLKDNIVAISGPSHAEEVSAKYHTCLNVAGTGPVSRKVIAGLLRNDYLQCRECGDVIGVELGGTLKNPAAVAAGIISVLPGCGDNLAGALISEALKEMVALAGIFRLREDIMNDISGLGDLVATALSDHSRNRRFGRDIAKQIMQKGTTLRLYDRILLKLKPQSVIERMSKKLHYLAEGAYAIEPLIELADRHHISIPVYRSLYEVLLNKKDPSLLIETIKDPAKFEEIYRKTKIHLTEGKSGLERISGKVFRNAIIQRTADTFRFSGNEKDVERRDIIIAALKDSAGVPAAVPDVRTAEDMSIAGSVSAANYNRTIERLAGRFTDEIVDSHSVVFKWLYLLYLKFFVVRRQGNFSYGRDVDGEIRAIRGIDRSDNVIYCAACTSPEDFIYLVTSIGHYGLPFPRYMVNRKAVKNRFHEYCIKYSGGFIVDFGKLRNPLYKEALRRYLSIMIEHGVPILHFQQAGGGEDPAGFFELIVDSLYTFTTEIVMVPVRIRSGSVETGRSPRIDFLKPLRLSEFTKAPYSDMKVSDVIRVKWEQAIEGKGR